MRGILDSVGLVKTTTRITMRKNWKLFLMTFFLPLLMNCTGWNAFVTFGQWPNTNPAKEYAYPLHTLGLGGIVYHKNNVPGAIGMNTKEGIVTSQVCAMSLLGLVAVGDTSIETTKKAKNITKVAAIEYEQTAFLGFVYHKFCTIVHGTTESAVMRSEQDHNLAMKGGAK